MRLQEYGVDLFDSCPTKSSLKKAIKKGYIRVNGKIASTATLIGDGDAIELNIPNQAEKYPELDLKLEVLFEDEYLAIVRKPPGLLTSGNKLRTLANALCGSLRTSAALDAVQPQPVHRLDYETSGLVLVGKTHRSIRKLNALFEDRKIHKSYYAITIGEMGLNGTIELPVDGKDALTEYEVKKSVSSHKYNFLNLVKLFPRSGRQNQIRIHLFETGNPILGDKKYGREGLISRGNGLYLHAYSLEFAHPENEKSLYIEDKLPKKFERIFRSKQIDVQPNS